MSEIKVGSERLRQMITELYFEREEYLKYYPERKDEIELWHKKHYNRLTDIKDYLRQRENRT
jgi:hypothetical protein